MILVEANILLYACNSTTDLHAESRDWLDEKLNGTALVGLPWPSLLAFLRIATNSGVFRSPLTMAVAWEEVSSWLSPETVWVPEPTEQHAAVLGKLLALPGIYRKLVPECILPHLPSSTGSPCVRPMETSRDSRI